MQLPKVINQYRAVSPLCVVWCLLGLLLLPCVSVAGQVQIDEPAPDFALGSSLGVNLRLSEQRGDVVLLTFWTQSCGSCREQLDQLEDLYQAHRESGFTVVSVAVVDDPVADVLLPGADEELGVQHVLAEAGELRVVHRDELAHRRALHIVDPGQEIELEHELDERCAAAARRERAL